MQTTFQVIHSLTRWGVVLFGAWALLNALTGVIGKRAYGPGDNRSSLLFMIFCDIQLLIGLFLFFKYGWFEMVKTDFSGTMKSEIGRFFTMEHSLMMIIAWLLVHVGRSAVKKAATDAGKHKRSLLFFGLAILIILVSIPWPFRGEMIGRPWFHWFN